MEFRIDIAIHADELAPIEHAIRSIDPAAVVDVDPDGRHLRVAGSFEGAELRAILQQAGKPVSALQIVQLPSICCGGCSG